MNIFLETQRLIFKKPDINDCEQIHILESDEIVMKYINIDIKTHTKDKIQAILKKLEEHQNEFGYSIGSIFKKETGEFIGRAGLLNFNHPEVDAAVEIGCTLLKNFWHKGYANEISKALIQWAFSHTNIRKIIGLTHPNNILAQNTLKKLNMHYEKSFFLGGQNISLYSIVKENYLAQ